MAILRRRGFNVVLTTTLADARKALATTSPDCILLDLMLPDGSGAELLRYVRSIDPAGKPWFLEAGLYCSFAPTSVIAVMAAAAGMNVADLFADQLRELDIEGARCLSSPR